MDDKEKLSMSFYHILIGFKDTFSLPTDSTLEKVLKLSVVLTIVTAILTAMGFFTFLSWQGCLLCTIILVALLWKERSENDALLRMYRDARVSAQKVAQHAKTAGARVNSVRRSASTNSGEQKVNKREEHRDNSTHKGCNGSSGRSQAGGRNSVPNTGNERRNSNRR